MSRERDNLFHHLGDAVNYAGRSVENVFDHTLGNLIRLPRRRITPGASPGIRLEELERMDAGDQPVEIHCIDYCPQWAKVRDIGEEEFGDFIKSNRPEGTAVRWINVNGLSQPHLIRQLAEKYNLHPLAIEDMFNIPQRPKVETFPATGDHHARLFIIAQMIRMPEKQIITEQVSLFLGPGTVLTFQQTSGDVWDPIRQRIQQEGSRLRNNDPSYLIYALLDAIVDHCFPILEAYGDKLENLEEKILNPDTKSRNVIGKVHALKRELLLLRRQMWPMREVVNELVRGEDDSFSDITRTYMRDVYDHAVQIIDLLETYRELAGGLADTWMTVVGNRMNEVMKVLTIFATIFIPITFIAGVYGMNFDHMPELHKEWAYPTFWAICSIVAVTMLVWFRRKGWL